MSEIVIDVAPKAELYLYTFAAEVEFLDTMDYAMEQDVDLITMSAGSEKGLNPAVSGLYGSVTILTPSALSMPKLACPYHVIFIGSLLNK